MTLAAIGPDPHAAIGPHVLGAVGPLSLAEHLTWFVVLSLVVFLVYHGLRTDSVAEAARTGVRRWLLFLVGASLLGAIGLTLATVL